jgi:hypothetical protein
MKNPTRFLVVAAFAVALPSSILAQKKADPASSSSFEPGSKILSVDLLAGNSGAYAGVGASAAFEVGVTKIADRVVLGIGGSLGLMHDSYGYLASSNVSVNQYMFFVMANGHYQFANIPQLDVYAGPSVGFTNWSFSSGNAAFHRASETDPAVGVQIGGRWSFSDKLSAMAQLGEGLRTPILTAGLTIRF